MNFQHSALDDGPVKYSTDIFVETYAEELRRRPPEVAVTVNASEYYTVYGARVRRALDRSDGPCRRRWRKA